MSMTLKLAHNVEPLKVGAGRIPKGYKLKR